MTIEKLSSLKKQHYQSTTPMDEYFTGFYNGIECVACLLEKREPEYKEVEKPSARKRHLETLISGHMEAMRPLLDEWSNIK